jgi:hypothetical protein
LVTVKRNHGYHPGFVEETVTQPGIIVGNLHRESVNDDYRI